MMTCRLTTSTEVSSSLKPKRLREQLIKTWKISNHCWRAVRRPRLNIIIGRGSWGSTKSRRRKWRGCGSFSPTASHLPAHAQTAPSDSSRRCKRSSSRETRSTISRTWIAYSMRQRTKTRWSTWKTSCRLKTPSPSPRRRSWKIISIRLNKLPRRPNTSTSRSCGTWRRTSSVSSSSKRCQSGECCSRASRKWKNEPTSSEIESMLILMMSPRTCTPTISLNSTTAKVQRCSPTSTRWPPNKYLCLHNCRVATPGHLWTSVQETVQARRWSMD